MIASLPLLLDASNTYLILQLFPCFSVAVSGLPDLTGKWKQAFTILPPVDFGQPVFTGKAVTPIFFMRRIECMVFFCLLKGRLMINCTYINAVCFSIRQISKKLIPVRYYNE